MRQRHADISVIGLHGSVSRPNCKTSLRSYTRIYRSVQDAATLKMLRGGTATEHKQLSGQSRSSYSGSRISKTADIIPEGVSLHGPPRALQRCFRCILSAATHAFAANPCSGTVVNRFSSHTRRHSLDYLASTWIGNVYGILEATEHLFPAKAQSNLSSF